MPDITRNLLRKRAEHNEGLLTTLQEITLHQEEIERINETLGLTCRKLKILYLQNNIISKMENLFHLKDLEYLNLALNNISKIEGLQNCEFLRKLDLTVNFIGFKNLKESIGHLESRLNLRELFMMGNPAQVGWPKFNSYVIARLPQLQSLDGTEITKSMKIKAKQALPSLEMELLKLVEEESSQLNETTEPLTKGPPDEAVKVEDVDEEVDNKMTENTPEVRVKIYRELAEQKKEKEDRAKVNAPKERDYDAEQKSTVEEIRSKEALESTDIKQKNEGGWDFFWDEESKPGYVILDVRVARFLDTSLIDVDVHPTYISIVIKSKTLRLRLPAEVKVSESKCQRSKTTGGLLVTMPKVNPKDNYITIRGDMKAKSATSAQITSNVSATSVKNVNKARGTVTTIESKGMKKLSLHEQMMLDAMNSSSSNGIEGQLSSKTVDIANIVTRKAKDDVNESTIFQFQDETNLMNEKVNTKIVEI